MPPDRLRQYTEIPRIESFHVGGASQVLHIRGGPSNRPGIRHDLSQPDLHAILAGDAPCPYWSDQTESRAPNRENCGS
jgi:hypothetical protein